MTNSILTSKKLTALEEDLHRLKASAAQSRATVWQLTQMLNPQAHAETVRRVENETVDKATRNGVISTGVASEKDEAARKADELARTLAGEPLADAASIEEKLGREHRQWKAYENACEFRTREIEAERNVLAIAFARTQKPTHDALMVRFCRPLLELHAVAVELYTLERHLIHSGVGLRGLSLTLPDFFPNPIDKTSDLADFLREAKREGFITGAISKELRAS